jgi:hypothetical protein
MICCADIEQQDEPQVVCTAGVSKANLRVKDRLMAASPFVRDYRRALELMDRVARECPVPDARNPAGSDRNTKSQRPARPAAPNSRRPRA